MTKEDIEARIKELETIKEQKNKKVQELKVQRATKDAELKNIQTEITTTDWINSDERRELEDLQIALRIINQ